MKKVVFILTAVLVLVNFALAGDDAKPMTKMGDRAWMFTLSGLSALGAGNYWGGVGGKYYFQDDMALRAGVGFSTTNNPDPATDPTDWNIAAGVQYNYATNNAVTAYVGGMVGYWSQDKHALSSANWTSFSLAGLAGVEWFPWNNIGFQAEYQLGFMSKSPKDPPAGATTDATSSVSLGSVNGSNLTVSVYF